MKTFDEIYAENYAKLHRVAAKMVCNKEDASDIVQEVFMGLYEMLDDGKDVVYFNTWLYRVTINKCIDCVKRQKRFSTLDGSVISPDSGRYNGE
ncbi:MAG: sigma-70 family RNA polymerase sigma factor [Methanobacterium paludis]|nr:sigma-70 family RNA polymerase sigma factor [Methanobacterium paludis]